MVFEESLLVLQSGSDGFGLIDIPLTSVHYGDVSEPKRNDSACQDVNDVCSLIPEIRARREV